MHAESRDVTVVGIGGALRWPLVRVRGPIGPHVRPDQTARSADHLRTKRSQGYFVGQPVDIHDGAIAGVESCPRRSMLLTCCVMTPKWRQMCVVWRNPSTDRLIEQEGDRCIRFVEFQKIPDPTS
jgi:hypothetical protein